MGQYKSIEDFKNSMVEKMKENFTTHGYLTPVMFFLKDGQLLINKIPNDCLASRQSKEMLAVTIKRICTEPNVLAGGIIIEAYLAKVSPDSESAKKALANKISVSQMPERVDAIVMIFSTPEKEELITYEVDCKNKIVKDMDEDMKKGVSTGKGTFSGFFNWTKN